MRIASLNIHAGRCGTGERQPSLPEISDLLRSVTPDICLLQEVDRRLPRSRFLDQAGVLARSLRAPNESEWYFAYFGVLNFGPLGQYGNAILARNPFTDIQRLPLPATGGEPRGAIRICFPEYSLSVWNAHLGLRSEWRRSQLERLAGAILEARQDGYSVLVGGDFNATINAPEMQWFVETSGLVSRSSDAATFPATAPTDRIDFLFTTPDIASPKGGITACPTATDHCLIWADITLNHDGADQSPAVN